MYNDILSTVTSFWLKAEIQARTLDVKDVADLAGLSQSAVYEILNDAPNRPNTVGRVKIFLALYPHQGI